MSGLDDLLKALQIPTGNADLKYELETLQAIRQWAIDQLGLDYEEGDRVMIIHPRPSQVGGGWAHWSEALEIGQTGIAGELKFDKRKGEWYLIVGMDRAWSVSDFSGKRYWHGPAHLTPEGYEPPSKHDQEHHPDGQTQWFHMDPSWIQKFTGEIDEGRTDGHA